MKKYIFKLNGCGDEKEDTGDNLQPGQWSIYTDPESFNKWYGPMQAEIFSKYGLKKEQRYQNEYYSIDKDNDTTMRIFKGEIELQNADNSDTGRGFKIPKDKILSCEGVKLINPPDCCSIVSNAKNNWKFENYGTIEIKSGSIFIPSRGSLTNKGTITIGEGTLENTNGGSVGSGITYNYGKIVETGSGRAKGRIENKEGGTITYYKDGQPVNYSAEGSICLPSPSYCS